MQTMFVSNCIESWLGFWSIALPLPPATGRLCLVMCRYYMHKVKQ